MRDDPLRLELRQELCALRRSAGPLSIEQVAAARRLVEFAGNGSAEQAHTVLLDLLDQQQFLGETDVVIYFASCGIGATGDSLNTRLADYAATHFIDTRTVLRHSDAGADKLSTILRDLSVMARPLGRINLVQQRDAVTCQILIRLPRHSKYRRPDVYLNGFPEKVDGLAWELTLDPHDPEWLIGAETLPAAELRITNKTDKHTPVWSVAVYWLMPVWSSWATAMELSDSRLSTVLSVTRNYRAELALYFDRHRK